MNFIDEELCYAILDLPIYPLKGSIDLPPETGDDRFLVTLVDKSLVLDKINEVLEELKVKLDMFALLTW